LFEEDLALFIAKEFVPLSFVEVPFFRRLWWGKIHVLFSI
jgi:hypothetical protein